MNGIKLKVLREGTRVDSVEDGVYVSRACCSAVVLIRDGKNNIVVDPGARGYANEIIAKLLMEGLSPADINLVVNTHTHLDHTFNNYLFPNAVIHTPTSRWYPTDDNKVVLYGKTTDPEVDGVRFISTPGHMERHISVIVETRGKTVVVAGDAVRESIIDAGKKPMRYPHPEQYVESMRMIFEIADEIIPGHGHVIGGERLKRLRKKLIALKT
jgi:glyoxylase-like metal-dependent hydrolase (beta-lactamase superfamily II)